MRPKTLWTTLIALAMTGMVMAGNGAQQGSPAAGSAVTSLTDAQKSTILFMREEEKLARDVYLTMDDLWDGDIFANIADSEQRHMDAIGQLITRYGLEDPVGNNAIGVFKNTELAALYQDLIAQGSASLQEALKVGVLVEKTDIEDLEKALSIQGLPTSVRRVFTNLLAASQRHLEAFETCSATGQTSCTPLACNGAGAQVRGQQAPGSAGMAMATAGAL